MKALKPFAPPQRNVKIKIKLVSIRLELGWEGLTSTFDRSVTGLSLPCPVAIRGALQTWERCNVLDKIALPVL